MMSPPKKDNVFRALDRKLGAVAEFTMRQYRTKLSTWVILGVGTIAIFIVVLFYVDSMQQEIEAIDNDGDSMDWDGDGYPTGQERIYGTDQTPITQTLTLEHSRLRLPLIHLKNGSTKMISIGICLQGETLL